MRPPQNRTKKTQKPPSSPQNARARANAALLAAAAEGDFLGVRLALEEGADVNARDARGRTALVLAITGGDGSAPHDMAQMERAWRREAERASAPDTLAPVIQILLKAGVPVNVADNEGMTPLLIAIILGNQALCRELLRRRANVNYRASKGLAPLGLATYLRNGDIVELLVKNRADIKRYGMEGQVPLIGVAMLRSAVRAKQSESEDTGSIMGMAMVQLASGLFGRGNDDDLTEDTVERLLKAGVDPNEKGKEGVTPLMMAAGLGSPRLARRLIDRGAKVDATSADGSTALFVAASEGRADTARALLEAGANPHTANRHGDTPLMAASAKACYALVERLLAAGAKTDVRNIEGQTARDIAVGKHYTAIIRLLDTPR